jgi:hypothetical protein
VDGSPTLLRVERRRLGDAAPALVMDGGCRTDLRGGAGVAIAVAASLVMAPRWVAVSPPIGLF